MMIEPRIRFARSRFMYPTAALGQSVYGQGLVFGLLSIIVFGFGCKPDKTAVVQGLSTETAGHRVVVSVPDKPEKEVRIEASSHLTGDTHIAFADEECCSDPGSSADCWWRDARNDGVLCEDDNDCAGGFACNTAIHGPRGELAPNGWGLCGCESDEDCKDGDRDGVCTEIDGEQVCGPSFCNGYLVCSCFSGCKRATTGGYDSPGEMCADRERGFPGECCEGNYPSTPDGTGLGFCSSGCDGTTPSGSACETDTDCEAETMMNPYSADCARFVCDDGTCRVDYFNAGDVCSGNVQITDPTLFGEAVRNEAENIYSCFEGRCDSAGKCIAFPEAANGLYCDDDDSNSCTDEICRAGVCEHDYSENIGHPCNNDGDACTLDECDGIGQCDVGPLKDCDDDNWCTFEDRCHDPDPAHIEPICINPPRDGNAAEFGYVDTTDCMDLSCREGIEVSTPWTCGGYNPQDLDSQCNRYGCVEGHGEDNCVLSYQALVGTACSDGDPCTINDTCIDARDHGVCQGGAPMDCDDGNVCTASRCEDGVCQHTPLNIPCDDGNPCTIDDRCDAHGSCVAGDQRECSGLTDACTNGVCNRETGTCEAQYLPQGTACNADDNPCTVNDTCDGEGRCVTGDLRDCSSETDACNVGVCDVDNGTCVKDPAPRNGDPCDADDNACTRNDTCSLGVCQAGALVSCAEMNDACNVAVCNSESGACEYDNADRVGAACNADDNGCTADMCTGDASGGGRLTCAVGASRDCDDANPCTLDACSSSAPLAYECTHVPTDETVSCNADDNGCTENDHCDGDGNCLAGVAVSATHCEAEIEAAGFDLECNAAECMSTGRDTYECVPALRNTALGGCNADNDACSLDYCVSDGAGPGAFCTVGAPRDCSAYTDPPCREGACEDSGDFYHSACIATFAEPGEACNADNDGCTEDDHCDEAGFCVPGEPPECGTSDRCHEMICVNLDDDNAHACEARAVSDCCINDDDCIGMGFECEPDNDCIPLMCIDGMCECVLAMPGTPCEDDTRIAGYPENCYDHACNSEGICEAVIMPVASVDNNLCSDLFLTGTPTSLDTGGAGYLGEFSSRDGDGAVLDATGSTLCGANNYNGAAVNGCVEPVSGADLGATSNDVVFALQYQAPASDTDLQFAYIVKVEADFDVAVYADDDVATASACPEGNHPEADDPSACMLVTGDGEISFDIWDSNIAGISIADIPLLSPPTSSGTYTQLESAVNRGALYGQRIRGYLVAPATGPYTFFVSGNDNVALYLSTDSNVANRREIAYHTGWTNYREWDKYATQRSEPIALVAGERYYIEVLHKENTGDDHVSVGWSRPGENTEAPSEIVPGRQLSPFDGGNGGTRGGACSLRVDWPCTLPYEAAPPPEPIEASCSDTGNQLNAQICCDPCIEGEQCGYKWCARGYNVSNDNPCDRCDPADPELGNCEAVWTAPASPFSCESRRPGDAGYAGFDTVATTIIHPTATDGAVHNAMIYVDGIAGQAGNFYLSVEKRIWRSTPCEHANDRARVIDITDAGVDGTTYQGTIENLVNSNHAPPQPVTDVGCGGFDCDGGFEGRTLCHDASSPANPFWPAEAYYMIRRSIAEGAASYCITTGGPLENGLDTVLVLKTSSDASAVCFDDYTEMACANGLSGPARLSVFAEPGIQYLIGVSRFGGLNRPCLNAAQDGCDYALDVRLGACPTCSDGIQNGAETGIDCGGGCPSCSGE